MRKKPVSRSPSKQPWEETVELAKQVTRVDGGVQYRGLDPGNSVIWISQPLALAAVDYKTDRASINQRPVEKSI
jgi:multiple sugar transport system substrate-binding protein